MKSVSFTDLTMGTGGHRDGEEMRGDFLIFSTRKVTWENKSTVWKCYQLKSLSLGWKNKTKPLMFFMKFESQRSSPSHGIGHLHFKAQQETTWVFFWVGGRTWFPRGRLLPVWVDAPFRCGVRILVFWPLFQGAAPSPALCHLDQQSELHSEQRYSALGENWRESDLTAKIMISLYSDLGYSLTIQPWLPSGLLTYVLLFSIFPSADLTDSSWSWPTVALLQKGPCPSWWCSVSFVGGDLEYYFVKKRQDYIPPLFSYFSYKWHR